MNEDEKRLYILAALCQSIKAFYIALEGDLGWDEAEEAQRVLEGSAAVIAKLLLDREPTKEEIVGIVSIINNPIEVIRS